MEKEGAEKVRKMMNLAVPYFVKSKKSENVLDLFIKNYIIMNHETTKHGNRACRTDQQGCEFAEEVTVKSKSDRMLAGRIRDVAATGVSVCARSRKVWEGFSFARGEGGCDCEITCEHDRASADVETGKKCKYRRDYNRGAKDLLERKWDLKRTPDLCRLSMSLIG